MLDEPSNQTGNELNTLGSDDESKKLQETPEKAERTGEPASVTVSASLEEQLAQAEARGAAALPPADGSALLSRLRFRRYSNRYQNGTA